MNQKNVWRIVGLLALVVVIAGFFVVTSSNPPANKEGVDDVSLETITLSIEGVYDKKSITITEHEMLLKVLERLNTDDPALRMKTKDYPGLGILVEGFGDKINGADDKYWQYKVNGVTPQIGADKYDLHGGEEIEWEFSSFELES